MTSGEDRMDNREGEPVRFWVRAAAPGASFLSWPFLPFGLVALAGLVALMLMGWSVIAVQAVEGSARLAAQRALLQAGEDWVEVEMSGQVVRLKGAAPSPEAGLRAVEAVRAARVTTWLGAFNPAARVTTRFTYPAEPARANMLSPAQARPPARFLLRLNAGRLMLGGEIGSAEAARQIELQARARLAPPFMGDVTNRLQVTGAPAMAGYEEVMLRAIDGLSMCESGTASFADETFSFSCEASDEKVGAIAALVRAGLPLGGFGVVEILPREAARSCEEDLAELLKAARIEFAPGSALLNVASLPVLDLAAAAAIDCPGTLRIEGHTDSTGSAEVNEALSLRRAEAVRAALIARGVPAQRLVAAGFGAALPAGDNDTEEGRARNRRIEIRVVRPIE